MIKPADTDVLILGAGPAGLAAASGLAGSGMSVTVVDSGVTLARRSRHADGDITQGVGGAGLFSDGKFSFFPSATHLWRLKHRGLLKSAYTKTVDLVARHGMAPPAFPVATAPDHDEQGEWRLKAHPAFYMSLADRYELTRELARVSGAAFLLSTTVQSVRFDHALGRFDVALRADSITSTLSARYVVFAGGRFGPVKFPLATAMSFRRLEVGVRIEQPAAAAFFGNLKQLDPKLRLCPGASTEWRTFCACREGETVFTNTQGIWTVSGRADCPPSGRSNIGFNVRLKNAPGIDDAWRYVLRSLQDRASYFDVSLERALTLESSEHKQLAQVYGPLLTRRLLAGLQSLAADNQALLVPQTRLIGPCLEGVSYYPTVEPYGLRIPGAPAWVVGDSAGLFRGIVAALVSGFYAAGEITRLEDKRVLTNIII